MKGLAKTPIVSAVLFVLAAALLGFGTVGAVQAAPRVESNDYRAEVELTEIQTALVEFGSDVEGDDAILQSAFREANGLGADGSGFQVGKRYDEQLAVKNIGTMPEYVRVTVYRYWETDGAKNASLDPSLIDIEFAEGSNWSVDAAASTPERTVLYYKLPVAPGETTEDPFVTGLTVKPDVLTTVNAAGDLAYDGAQFRVKAVADAVQTHNAADAQMSAWGRTV